MSIPHDYFLCLPVDSRDRPIVYVDGQSRTKPMRLLQLPTEMGLDTVFARHGSCVNGSELLVADTWIGDHARQTTKRRGNDVQNERAWQQQRHSDAALIGQVPTGRCKALTVPLAQSQFNHLRVATDGRQVVKYVK